MSLTFTLTLTWILTQTLTIILTLTSTSTSTLIVTSTSILTLILTETSALLRVAKGEESGQPAAADMRELVWDDELEAIAQR